MGMSVGVCGLIFSQICHMQAAPMWAGGGGGGAHGGGGGRAVTLPPRWGPQMERSYSFLDWTQDLLTWSILSDMDPPRQCAAIITQLEGSARLLARNMTFDDITRGGVIGGQQQDPVTFLLTHLAQQFAPLGEEQRLRYVNELMNFDRLPRESTDDMLTRYMTVRFRAQQGPGNPQLGMSWET